MWFRRARVYYKLEVKLRGHLCVTGFGHIKDTRVGVSQIIPLPLRPGNRHHHLMMGALRDRGAMGDHYVKP